MPLLQVASLRPVVSRRPYLQANALFELTGALSMSFFIGFRLEMLTDTAPNKFIKLIVAYGIGCLLLWLILSKNYGRC
jgi:hypothetical protein